MDKADFYMEDDDLFLRWIGSVQSFASPYDLPLYLLNIKISDQFEKSVQYYLCETVNDGVTPENGWPHLWDDSRMTAYSYIFIKNKIYCSMMGGFVFDPITIKQGGDMFEAIIGIPPIIPFFPNVPIYEEAKNLLMETI